MSDRTAPGKLTQRSLSAIALDIFRTDALGAWYRA